MKELSLFKLGCSAICFALVLLIFAPSLFAHTGASGIVKERMDAMQDMGDKTKIIDAMFKGKRDFEHAAVVDAADSYVKHGATMAALFPDTLESRTGKKTEALPRIWVDWNEFSEIVDEFNLRSVDLQKSALVNSDIDTLRPMFLEVAKQCSGCHKRFREPRR